MLAMEVLRIVQKSNDGEARYDAIIVLEGLIFLQSWDLNIFSRVHCFVRRLRTKKETSCLQSNSFIVSVAEFYKNQISE